MNLPYTKHKGNKDTSLHKQIYIQPSSPTNPKQDDIWIDTSKTPNAIYKYNQQQEKWLPLRTLEQDIYLHTTEPENKYNGLLWIKLDNSGNVESLKVYSDGKWLDILLGGGGNDTYKVKAKASDLTPGYLDSKVDDRTIEVNDSDKLGVKFQDDKKEDVVWSSQRITKEAIIKAIIFG